MNRLIFFLIFILLQNLQCQVLHHQMISSQGNSNVLSGGLVVNQTIGQQSLIGNSRTNYYVAQGFQQSLWGMYLDTSKKELVKMTVYPNPFMEKINFHILNSSGYKVGINVFDLAGRLVFFKDIISEGDVLTIDLGRLPSAKYLVSLNFLNHMYYAKIIKKE